MKFNQLEANKQITSKRVGRGISSGRGKTAGRGTKGQKARTGGSIRPGFEGGQMPLAMRLPKLRGFRSHHIKPESIYTLELNDFKAKTVDNTTLFEAGLVTSAFANVKLLYNGEVTKPVDVKLQSASKQAIASIQKAGGKYQKLARPQRSKKA